MLTAREFLWPNLFQWIACCARFVITLDQLPAYDRDRLYLVLERKFHRRFGPDIGVDDSGGEEQQRYGERQESAYWIELRSRGMHGIPPGSVTDLMGRVPGTFSIVLIAVEVNAHVRKGCFGHLSAAPDRRGAIPRTIGPGSTHHSLLGAPRHLCGLARCTDLRSGLSKRREGEAQDAPGFKPGVVRWGIAITGYTRTVRKKRG